MDTGMERRRVQLTGTSTFTVSLPKAWAKRNGIRRGSELLIGEEQDGSLSIKLKAVENILKHKIINVEEYPSLEEVGRAVLAAYLNGCNIIEIRSKKEFTIEQRKVIAKQRKRLIGFEVTDEECNRVCLQDFFSSKYLSIERSIKRAFNISFTMQKDVISALTDIDESLVKGIGEREEEIDKLCFLVKRQLNLAINNSALMKSLGLTSSSCLTNAFLIKEIEKIADHTVSICSYLPVKRIQKNIIKKINELNNLSLGMYSNSIKSLTGRNVKLANSVLNNKKKIVELHEEANKLICELPEKTLFIVELIISNICSIGEHATEIAELIIGELSSADLVIAGK